MKKLLLFISTLAIASCTTPGKKTAVGGGIGAGVGAGLGALIGSNSGKAGKGALIGAGIGALLGGGVGNYLDKQAKELAEIADVKRTEDGIIAQLDGDLYFKTGDANISPDVKTKLDKMSSILVKYPQNAYVIEGHTDSQGDDSFNAKLSKKRANAVKNYLAQRGLAQAPMTVIGHGETNPIASNSTDTGRAQNRRVEVKINVAPEYLQQQN